MFKIFNNLVDLDPNNYFTMNNSGYTRGHPYKIRSIRSNTEIRSNFFTQRVVVPWNDLPAKVVLSNDVSQFKRNYDKYITKINKF